MERTFRFILLTLVFSLTLAGQAWPRVLQAGSELVIIDRSGNPTDQITDGNLIQLRLDPSNALPAGTQVDFKLEGIPQPVASCVTQTGEQSCQSEAFTSTGWYWGPDGSPQPTRSLQAVLTDGQVLTSTMVQVSARPVVMVHGFSSDYKAWTNYLGPQGYLAQIGIPGYAVGDGQVPGVMNTGLLVNPLGRTNTIAQNAAILGEYLAGVKRQTGAEQVDLLAHSMGGMISRYYIDRVMQTRDVTQLIMLGSPSLGTACANLPASLGYYLPATLEIQPEYAIRIFNPQITHRHGVPFFILAGDPIANPAGSPCTGVPSDLVISRLSATGIPLTSGELPILHNELNTSAEAFHGFVKSLLQKGPGKYPDEPDPVIQPVETDPIQFGQVFNGRLEPGQSQEIAIPIEAGIQVASFGLFDPSRSLNVEVRGASGNVIELSAENNGLIEVDDPEAMIYLGYGFNQPKPGIWKVTLLTTDQTPAGGTDYALTARFVGGASLKATASMALPSPSDPVVFQVSMSLNGQDLPITQATGTIKAANNLSEPLALQPEGDGYTAVWEAGNPGLYSVEFLFSGMTPDGIEIQRSAGLVLEVQPEVEQARPLIALVLLIAVIVLVLVLFLTFIYLILRGVIHRVKK